MENWFRCGTMMKLSCLCDTHMAERCKPHGLSSLGASVVHTRSSLPGAEILWVIHGERRANELSTMIHSYYEGQGL